MTCCCHRRPAGHKNWRNLAYKIDWGRSCRACTQQWPLWFPGKDRGIEPAKDKGRGLLSTSCISTVAPHGHHQPRIKKCPLTNILILVRWLVAISGRWQLVYFILFYYRKLSSCGWKDIFLITPSYVLFDMSPNRALCYSARRSQSWSHPSSSKWSFNEPRRELHGSKAHSRGISSWFSSEHIRQIKCFKHV